MSASMPSQTRAKIGTSSGWRVCHPLGRPCLALIWTTIVVYSNSIDSLENLKSAYSFRFSKISNFYIFEIRTFIIHTFAIIPNQSTNRPMTRLLELLRAAKNSVLVITSKQYFGRHRTVLPLSGCSSRREDKRRPVPGLEAGHSKRLVWPQLLPRPAILPRHSLQVHLGDW